ncbi:MAG: prepilin-type N-terminal cleavage/methylation domain-containing protein [Rubrivivax sp.]
MKRQDRGVSLIEALVALGVMAFGMLGLVGLQSTMRSNADIAKQRSEAVRIAQEQIEQQRGFVNLTGAGTTYANIASVGDTTYTDLTSTNSTYTWNSTVTVASTDPPFKTMAVDVNWTDRAGTAQTLRLVTSIAGIAPELAAALGTPANGTFTRNVRGRNPAIPPGAVSRSDGTSRFVPPGGGDTGWVFNNITGVITQVCDATFTTCNVFNGLLLSGFIRFDQDATPPTTAQTEVPISASFVLGVRVNLTAPTTPSHVDCFVDRQPLWSAYYCAMPLATTPAPASWSGTTELRGFNISDDASDDRGDRMRVCRYTPERSNAPAGGNQAHPLDYASVSTALTHQDFLIIRGGDGTAAYDCPADGPSTMMNTNTYAHQPALAS